MKKFLWLLILPFLLSLKPPELTPQRTVEISQEIMKAHASYKEINPMIMKRILLLFLDQLDPAKVYLTEQDIGPWLNPTDDEVNLLIQQYSNADFSAFEAMQKKMAEAIPRYRHLNQQIQTDELPHHIDPEEFRKLPWAKNEDELVERIKMYRSLQSSALDKMNPELKEKAILRLDKRRTKLEEDFLNPDPAYQTPFLLSEILKATASALDTHTAYLTPEEASQFMISVQQRLLGIGVQLRDDISGFTVVKVLDGGPAAKGKELKKKDLIVAVNGEPVVGMDIEDVVTLIRGPEGTPVTLTVLRDVNDSGQKTEEKHDIVILRNEVVLTETRFKVSYEPYGDGVIAYLRLFSFYQDADSSSAKDLADAFAEMSKDHKVLGLIFDLRGNSGGLLTQAVQVTGLFISKGVVVSIKDDKGDIQRLRNIDPKSMWNGPLVVLINRGSASASEIVAGTLQDYGRGLIVGDDHSFGKGSFQTFTLDGSKKAKVNPEGEYKVTRGRYYTVSGRTPQLVGVAADITVPGVYSESEVGEKYAKYPLESDRIEPAFKDDLSDIPFIHRMKVESLYSFDLQQKLTTYQPYLSTLKQNSAERILLSANYQAFLRAVKQHDLEDDEKEDEMYGLEDLQLQETYNIMRDLILLMGSRKKN